ncbi:LacI family DNA-binding transcriptional regulator [Curtobacterium ammoniigenes]|uniref:LacI family DNA-binding transcriptional regulator n=1 Tax=Curtobacterium ammoniigenes TaxID=395387 RepID=UPI00082CDB7D|nr:substrate-binding domain-containing protein [Curtobacterium ammoniigenes]
MNGGEPPKARATLADVARTAGTSVPTVSKVLRGGTDVSPMMRTRVMDAVRHVGYSRSAHAGAEEDPAPLIDLVMNHVHGTWANGVLTGVEHVATEANLDVVITIVREGRDWVTRLLRRPSRGAIVVLVDPTSSQLATLEGARRRVVLVTPMSEPQSDVSRVGVTNWDGGRAAAEHLLGLGHRRFTVIAGERGHLYSRARVDGFRSALTSAGLGRCEVVHADWDRELAASAAFRALEASSPPTAVFACSDVMAVGVYDAAARLGLEIPGDVSVVGFDDVPEARWAVPAMTTIRQPITEMGAVATQMLLTPANPSSPSTQAVARVDLATSLIVRASTGAPRMR